MEQASLFAREVMILGGPIYWRNVKEWRPQMAAGVAFESVGTPAEQQVRAVIGMQNLLFANTQELEQALVFLKIDLGAVNALYNGAITTQQYVQYHVDNFIVRLSTALDLCGKLGNVVFAHEVTEKQSNAYSFIKKTRPLAPDAVSKIEALQTYLNQYQQRRHEKVHKGISWENQVANVSFWQDFGRQFQVKEIVEDPLLISQTDEQVSDIVKEFQEVLDKKDQLANDFLDALIPQFRLLIATVHPRPAAD